ncbi:MAG: SDR family NAD(P)-dependent oxidoreductase, partial [Bacteroidota bacterium]
MSQKTAVISGASMGIGLALAERLLDEGYKVLGTNRNGIIPVIQHQNFHSIALDLTKQESIDKACREILGQTEGIDLLINNAGIGPDLGKHLP